MPVHRPSLGPALLKGNKRASYAELPGTWCPVRQRVPFLPLSSLPGVMSSKESMVDASSGASCFLLTSLQPVLHTVAKS